jgi:hypothetical protein
MFVQTNVIQTAAFSAEYTCHILAVISMGELRNSPIVRLPAVLDGETPVVECK